MRDISKILRGRALRRQAWKVLNVVVAAVTVFQVSSLTAAAQQVPTTPALNPALGQTCGLDIGLVVDRSGSMEPGEVTQMKTALGNFAAAFSGTPTVFSLSTFGTSSTLVDAFSLSPSQAATAIDTLPAFNDEEEMTNWEAGLGRGRDSFDPRAGNSNLIVIATDGSPNRFGYPTTDPSGLNYATALEPAVVMANTIKNAGTRVVVVGIGDDTGDSSSAAVKLDKMKAISGSSVALIPGDITVSTDVIKVADFNGIGAALASFARALCPGSITVNKQVDTTGNNQYQDGNGMGFTWTLDGGSPNAMGATVAAQPGTHPLAETLVPNYQFVGWHYTNADASCSNPQTLNGTTLPISLSLSPDEHASLTLCNKFVPVAPTLTITKSNNSGTSVNPGATVTYTVVVTNNAAATQAAQNVVMTDTLPLGFTFTIGGGSAKSFNLGTIAPGASVTTAYTASVSTAQAAGTFTNTATAKGDNTAMVSATSNVVVKVPQVLGVAVDPELTLTKTVNPGSTNPGKTVTYTLKVKNTSTADATNVIVTDTLPDGFTFADTGRATKTWTFAVLAGGAEKVITYKVIVGKSVSKGDYVNRAFVTADGLDPISAQAKVKVAVPQVKGLADTGVGFNDYAFFMAGLLLIAAGATMIFRLKRQAKSS